MKSRSIALLCAFLFGSAAAVACDACKGMVFGPPQVVGNGMAWTWIKKDVETKKPTAIGFSFTETALQGLAEDLPTGSTMRAIETMLMLPMGVKDIPFDHVTFDWNPKGHIPPGIYDVPHFDAHFFMISPKERAKMTASEADLKLSLVPPAPSHMPAGYVLPPLPAPGTYEPNMGSHWIDPTSPEFNGKPFTTTFIFGTFNARLLFYEPMFSTAFLATKSEVKKDLPLPTAVRKGGYYPTSMKISYNQDRKEYTVALEGLTFKKATR